MSEWGIEWEGHFVPLEHDVTHDQATAESALAEALDYGADPETTFVAYRHVERWVRVDPSSEV